MKAGLREEARARLRALDPAARATESREIVRQVWTLPEIAGAGTLLLFAALPDEPETVEIATEARRRGIAVVYPRCLPDRSMTLHAVASDDALQRGRFGIREPDAEACALVRVEEIDAALVPGLAWDRAGHRLGRGAGYYDRLFAEQGWRGFRCGLFFAAAEVPALPADPWDAPLDAVLTGSEIVRWGQGAEEDA
jgi:5-formyltetrahydrofolate cyclo-ligase